MLIRKGLGLPVMKTSKSQRLCRILDIGFIVILLAFLAIGAVKTCFYPKENNTYENRTANQLPSFSAEKALKGTFQDDVESAFSDQVFLAQTMESSYHFGNRSLQLALISSVLDEDEDWDRYVCIFGAQTYGGSHLVFEVYDFDDCKKDMDSRIRHLNQLIASYPELDFYSYYIEKETDLDLETGEKEGFSDYLRENLDLPEEKIGVFAVDDFDDLEKNFYRTDHHWNCEGSYRGYTDVLAMIDPDAEPLCPRAETMLPYPFSGSKASTTGANGVFTENFKAYLFDYPAMDIAIDGNEVMDYGNQEAYWTGAAVDDLTYGDFYGADAGEVVFDTHRPEKGNILVLGESYDNAILKLLAGHFNQTCAVDLRNYERECGQPFHFASYVRDHDITKVLLIGNVDYYLSDCFNAGD